MQILKAGSFLIYSQKVLFNLTKISQKSVGFSSAIHFIKKVFKYNLTLKLTSLNHANKETQKLEKIHIQNPIHN